ncbi:MAG: hypothetical protein IPK16_25515 [Anaerolineales bacterium]|nr:hypothetical protein [Anaerolineales bacterium]
MTRPPLANSNLTHRTQRPTLITAIVLVGCLVLGMTALGAPSLWVTAQGAAPTANPVLTLAVAPGAPDKVLAGVLNSPQPAGIYRTENGGASWQNSTPGLAANVSIAALAFSPRNARIALAADGGSGFLFRSNDGGATWNEVPGFKELLNPNSAVGELYAVVENGQTAFYAGTRFDGVFRSTDDGATWTRLDGGLIGEARRIREIIEFNGNLYAGTHAGLYRLPVGGTTWEQMTGFTDPGIIYSLAIHNDVLYAGTDTNLYQSADGQTWTATPGAPVTTYYDLASTGRILAAATETGLWNNANDAWQLASLGGAPYGLPVYALANTERAPRTLYAGTVDNWVLRSDDEGITYNSISTMPALDVRAALATATPTPTLTPTPTETATPTATATDTATPSPTPTATGTATPTNSPTPTNTRTPRPTATATNTPTGTYTPEPPATNTATTAPTIETTTAISIEVTLPNTNSITRTADLIRAQIAASRQNRGDPATPALPQIQVSVRFSPRSHLSRLQPSRRRRRPLHPVQRPRHRQPRHRCPRQLPCRR